MIDTHCHLLPRLDDGPDSDDEALALARGLAERGVGFVLCTPHYSRMFPTDHQEVLERVRGLVAILAREGVDLELQAAAELSPEVALSADPDELLARSIGRGFLLVELTPDTPRISVRTITDRLRKLELLPIFAHPERCRGLRSDHEPLDDARAQGALVQVVATSLVGRWGSQIEAAAWHLVETGRVDLIGSDAHHYRHRGVLLEAGELVSRHFGETARRELTEDGPRLVLFGTPTELRHGTGQES
jgi:protein-tyrosine phosphatase